MTALTLYEIAQEFRHITDVLMDSGVDEQTLADTLEGEQWPLEVKAQQYAFVIKNLTASADAIKAAEVQMSVRRKAIETRAAYLLERLKTGLEIAGISKIDCPHFAISIKRNPPSVDLFEPSMIPAQFMRQAEAPPPQADKRAIADAIKAGEDIPGAKLVQGTSLVIK